MRVPEMSRVKASCSSSAPLERVRCFEPGLGSPEGVSVMKRCKYLVPEARLQGGVQIRSFIFHIFLVGVALNSATVAQAQSKTLSPKGSQIPADFSESARVQNV